MGDKDIDRPITHRDRMMVQFHTEKGRVAVIHVIQYEARFNSEWVPVVRYDCAHGFFHRDLCHSDGRQDKEALFFSSLADALNYAMHDIKENWEQYRARYEAELESWRGGK